MKWWLTQHALPKSAILTLMTSRLRPMSSALRFSPAEDDEELEDLSREIPEMSLVRRSLMPRHLLVTRARHVEVHRHGLARLSFKDEVNLRGLFPLLLLVTACR